MAGRPLRRARRNGPHPFTALPFDHQLRQRGMMGCAKHFDPRTGERWASPHVVWFDRPDAAVTALAVFLYLEGADVSGAQDASTDHAVVVLRDGRVFEAGVAPDGQDIRIFGPGLSRPISWGSWVMARHYPQTSLFQ